MLCIFFHNIEGEAEKGAGGGGEWEEEEEEKMNPETNSFSKHCQEQLCAQPRAGC